MKAYADIVNKVFEEGVFKDNRTGIRTLAIPGAMFEHDMKNGFPLLTTKKVPFRLVAAELEFFIRGMTDKTWLQEQNCHIWDEWCTGDKVKYGHDPATKAAMQAERDLGPIYGWQWRNFGAVYAGYDQPAYGDGVDQLKKLVETLASNPNDRRMIVTAWNPVDIASMALPPCHYGFQVIIIDGKLNLMWNQRSVDVALGLPFNIASYALLLHLLALESGFQEGKLIGFLGDTHIYENHFDGLREQMNREYRPLPTIETACINDVGDFKSIFDWHYQDTKVDSYDPHPTIKFDIAV